MSKFLGNRSADWFSPSSSIEIEEGVKYGDRGIEKWTHIFNGRHLASLDRCRLEPNIILRWDPVLDCLYHNRARDNRITADCQDTLMRRGQPLYGFRCVDVYTEADWYQAKGISEKRPMIPWPSWPILVIITAISLGLESRFGNESFRRYERKTIRQDMQRRAAAASAGREAALGASDLYRWKLVSSAWEKYKPKPQAKNDSSPLFNSVCDRVANWPFSSVQKVEASEKALLVQILMATVAGALYGSLHLLAWDAVFTSSAQQFLWRFSGLLIASSRLILLSHILYDALFNKWYALLDLRRIATANSILFYTQYWFVFPGMMVMMLVAGWATLLYIPARFFLLVESCMQVARLPPAVYELPDCWKYYPHIG